MRQTVARFVQHFPVEFVCEQVQDRPDGLMQDSARHFRCRISVKTRSFSFYFSQGSALTKPPTLVDVLNCLALDATGFESAATFESWASDYGYSVDSRAAEKIYRTTRRQTQQLRRVLGDAAFKDLIENTDLD